jgi:hypothetical protein
MLSEMQRERKERNLIKMMMIMAEEEEEGSKMETIG